jgi:hypothetical protein
MSRMKSKALWTLVLFLALGAIIPVAPVRAAVTIGVSPSLVELSGKPGGDGSVDLTVLNQGDEPFDAAIEMVPLAQAGPELSVPDWLSTDTPSIHLEPQSQRAIKIKIAIPKDENSGTKYAGVAITTGASQGAQATENSASISGRLLVPFLITVNGKDKIKRSAEVEKFAAVLELDGRLGFRAQVSNTGSTHWKSSGKAVVDKSDGSSYGNLDLSDTTVFPLDSGIISTTSTLPVEHGASFSATLELDYGAKKPKKAETEFTFTPQLSINGEACENLDRGPTMTVDLVNSGDLGIMSVIQMSVATADGQPIGRVQAGDPWVAWPSVTTPARFDFQERLQTGDYVMSISVLTGSSPAPVVQEIPFSIGGTGPNVAPICPQPESTPGA